jgi:hypothetical protein
LDRSELVAARAAALKDLGPKAEAYDLVGPLIEVDKLAVAAGDEELSAQLRTEIQAASTHGTPAGMPEAGARFDFVRDELRRPEAIAVIAAVADDASLPPLVRGHFLDLLWNLESSPRAHPLAGRRAAIAYLDYDDVVGDDLPKAHEDAVGWGRWSDALARACELAAETGQRDVGQRAVAAVKRRLAQADRTREYRVVLEPGYGLLRMRKLVPDALQDITMTLSRARDAMLDAQQFHLARSVMDLQAELARASGRPEELHGLRRAAAEAYVAEADARAAEEGGGLLASVFLQKAIEELDGIPESSDRIAELTRRLEASNRTAGEHMGTVSAAVSIPIADMERYFNAFTRHAVPDALALIGDHFLLNRAKEYARYDENATKFIFSNLVTHTLLTEYGETMTFSPGTPEFRDYNVFRQAVQGMAISATFLRQLFVRLRSKGLDAATVMLYLDQCPILRLGRASCSTTASDGSSRATRSVPYMSSSRSSKLRFDRSSRPLGSRRHVCAPRAATCCCWGRFCRPSADMACWTTASSSRSRSRSIALAGTFAIASRTAGSPPKIARSRPATACCS